MSTISRTEIPFCSGTRFSCGMEPVRGSPREEGTVTYEIQFYSEGKLVTVPGELSITGGIMNDECEKNVGTLEDRLGYLQMTIHKINDVLMGGTEGKCTAVSEKTARKVSDIISGHIETVMHLEKCVDEILQRCSEIVELLG